MRTQRIQLKCALGYMAIMFCASTLISCTSWKPCWTQWDQFDSGPEYLSMIEDLDDRGYIKFLPPDESGRARLALTMRYRGSIPKGQSAPIFCISEDGKLAFEDIASWDEEARDLHQMYASTLWALHDRGYMDICEADQYAPLFLSITLDPLHGLFVQNPCRPIFGIRNDGKMVLLKEDLWWGPSSEAPQ